MRPGVTLCVVCDAKERETEEMGVGVEREERERGRDRQTDRDRERERGETEIETEGEIQELTKNAPHTPFLQLLKLTITITIYFINPSGKLKLSFDRTTKNIILNHEPHAHTHS